MTKKILFVAIFLFFLVIILFLPVSPLFQKTPPRDSGIFIYTASELLEGKLLYQGIWDHKPPVIFFINALGLMLSNGSIWGVWVMQIIFIYGTSLIALHILKDAFGLFSSTIGIAGALFTLHQVLHGGNYTEEYALFFQLGALFFFFWGLLKRNDNWFPLLSGVFIALSFFTRQNLISLGIGVLLFWLLVLIVKKNIFSLKSLLFTVVGFIVTSGIFCLIFVFNGTFYEFWDAAFYYNQLYSQFGLVERVNAILDELEFILMIPGFIFGLIAWIIGIIFLLFSHPKWINKLIDNIWMRRAFTLIGGLLVVIPIITELIKSEDQYGFGMLQISMTVVGMSVIIVFGLLSVSGIRLKVCRFFIGNHKQLPDDIFPLLFVAVISFPIDIIFISLSSRNYLHYFIALIPVIVLLITFLCYVFTNKATKFIDFLPGIALLIVVSITPIISLSSQYKVSEDKQVKDTVDYVTNNTFDEEPILVWGAEPIIYFFSERESVSRYPHVYPFYQDGEAAIARQEELASAIKENNPCIIIDTLNNDTQFIQFSPEHGCEMPEATYPEGLQQSFDYICDNYVYQESIGIDQWRVYTLKGN